jgi:hypothetical protein
MASLQDQVCFISFISSFIVFYYVLPFSCQGQPTSDEELLEEKRQEFIHQLMTSRETLDREVGDFLIENHAIFLRVTKKLLTKSFKAVLNHAEKEFCKDQESKGPKITTEICDKCSEPFKCYEGGVCNLKPKTSCKVCISASTVKICDLCAGPYEGEFITKPTEAQHFCEICSTKR